MARQTALFICVLLTVVGAAFAVPALSVGRCPNPPPAPDGNWASFATAKSFILDAGSGSPQQQTQVHMCYTNDSLYVKYEAQDHSIRSTFTQCNEPLYQQDAVEMFLTNPYHVNLQHYLELELSPHGVLFASRIFNPNYVCNGIQGTPIECKQTGIQYQSKTFPAENRWWGFLRVPFSLLKTVGEKHVVEKLANAELSTQGFKNWMVNFYRIDFLGESTTKEYSCWSPTDAVPPCFHKPKYFGVLDLN